MHVAAYPVSWNTGDTVGSPTSPPTQPNLPPQETQSRPSLPRAGPLSGSGFWLRPTPRWHRWTGRVGGADGATLRLRCYTMVEAGVREADSATLLLRCYATQATQCYTTLERRVCATLRLQRYATPEERLRQIHRATARLRSCGLMRTVPRYGDVTATVTACLERRVSLQQPLPDTTTYSNCKRATPRRCMVPPVETSLAGLGISFRRLAGLQWQLARRVPRSLGPLMFTSSAGRSAVAARSSGSLPPVSSRPPTWLLLTLAASSRDHGWPSMLGFYEDAVSLISWMGGVAHDRCGQR